MAARGYMCGMCGYENLRLANRGYFNESLR